MPLAPVVAGLRGPVKAVGVVLEDQPFQHGLGDLLLFRREVLDGLELQAAVIVRAALVLVEKQHIRAHAERNSVVKGDRFIWWTLALTYKSYK